MRLTDPKLQNLYIATAAAVHGALVSGKKYRDKPVLAALEARRHALLAVREAKRK